MDQKVSIDEIKLHLRLDHDYEDDLLNTLLSSAAIYLKNAGCIVTEGELYNLAIKILVSHWYENRAVETAGKNVSKIAFGLDTIIVQLKYTQGDAI